MPTQSEVAVATPLLLAALITTVMTPAGTKLTEWRTRQIYSDTDGVIYGVDLFSVSVLCLVVPVVTALAGITIHIRAIVIVILCLAVSVLNVIALIWMLVIRDHHKYVDRFRLLLWSYPVIGTIFVTIGAGVMSAVLVH